MSFEKKLTHEIAVLGGGVAGLAAGITSKAPVFEACDIAGGIAASDRVDGYVFDRGIHILQSKNQEVLDLLDELGVEFDVRERKAFIYSHGTYTPYPFQVNTAGMPLGLRVRCVRDFFARDKHPEPDNYEQWMYKNLGSGFAETFLIPYSEKFWGVSPREMTHEWTGNRVPKPSTFQVVRGALWSRNTKIGTNATFKYPKAGQGYGAVPDALASRVDELNLNHRACEIDLEQQRLRFDNNTEVNYGVLINSIPLPALISLVKNEVPETVSQAASRLRTNSIRVVNLGIDRANISDRHWLHFPEKDVCFFRLSYPQNLDPDCVPAGKSAVSVEVAYSDSNPVDNNTIVEQVIKDLIKVGVLRADDTISTQVTYDIPLAYCIYDPYREQAVETIADWLAQYQIITCGRYGLWAYFWSDESIASGLRAGEQALQKIEMQQLDEPVSQLKRSNG